MPRKGRPIAGTKEFAEKAKERHETSSEYYKTGEGAQTRLHKEQPQTMRKTTGKALAGAVVEGAKSVAKAGRKKAPDNIVMKARKKYQPGVQTEGRHLGRAERERNERKKARRTKPGEY